MAREAGQKILEGNDVSADRIIIMVLRVSIDDRTTKVDNRSRLKTWTIIKVTQSVVSKSGLTVQFFFRIFKISSKFVEVASGFFSSPDSVFIFFCDSGVSTTCSRKRFRLLGAALLGELSAISPSSTSGSCVSSTSESESLELLLVLDENTLATLSVLPMI